MEKKLGPTELQAEIERLKAAGQFPALDDVLNAVGDTRSKYRDKILEAQKSGEDDAKNGK